MHDNRAVILDDVSKCQAWIVREAPKAREPEMDQRVEARLPSRFGVRMLFESRVKYSERDALWSSLHDDMRQGKWHDIERRPLIVI